MVESPCQALGVVLDVGKDNKCTNPLQSNILLYCFLTCAPVLHNSTLQPHHLLVVQLTSYLLSNLMVLASTWPQETEEGE